MNNTIRRLRNGDFEVVYDKDNPRPGHVEVMRGSGPWKRCACNTSYRTDRCPTCEPTVRPAPGSQASLPFRCVPCG